MSNQKGKPLQPHETLSFQAQNKLAGAYVESLKEISRLRSLLSEAEGALNRYKKHDGGCYLINPYPENMKVCTCGLQKALLSISKMKEGR